MNEGLQILIERMRNHPDEFNGKDYRRNKWGSVFGEVDNYMERGFFTDEEVEAFKQARWELVRKLFTADVLEALENVNRPVQEPTQETTAYAYDSSTRLAGTGLSGAVLTNANGGYTGAWVQSDQAVSNKRMGIK